MASSKSAWVVEKDLVIKQEKIHSLWRRKRKVGVERSWEGAGKVSALTDSTLSVVTYASLTLA